MPTIEHKLTVDNIVDGVKNHVKRHKTIYISAGVAGITLLIMRKSRIEALALRGACGPETADTLVTNRPFSFLSSGQSIQNVVIRQELGRPPYLIHDVTADLYYGSQSAAAKTLGTSNSTVSRHLRRLRSHVNGHELERVEVV